MFKVFFQWVSGKKKDNPPGPKRIINETSRIPLDDTKQVEKNTHNDLAGTKTIEAETELKQIRCELVQVYDENMLNRAREQWKFGEWERLSRIGTIDLEHHPDRAKLALLVAAAFQQKNELATTRQWVQLAKEWGCDKKLIAKILIAGVHNTIGRAAGVYGNNQLAHKHFEVSISIGTPGNSVKSATHARIGKELGRLGLCINQLLHANGINVEIGFNQKQFNLNQLRQFLGSPPALIEDKDINKNKKDFPCFGKAIFIVGMRHSGSTALFNIVRIILKKKRVKFTSYYSENEQQKKLRSQSDQLRLIKTHEFRDDHIMDAVAIISARRDIRDTVASASRRKFHLLEKLGGAVEYAKYNRALHDIWKPYCDYCFVYEEYISDPISSITAVLAFLGVEHLDPKEIFEEIKCLPTDQYDTTLLSPTHITDPERKLSFHDTLDSESLAKINSNHATWLREYGYSITV